MTDARPGGPRDGALDGGPGGVSEGAAAPAVSVLIPFFDNADTVLRAIDSALGQSLGDLEVIAVDDASADDGPARVAARAAQDPRLRLVGLARNAGPGAARSAGLAAARGRWIAILDADDTMAPDRLARLVAEAERDGLDAIADNLALIDPQDGACNGRAFPLEDAARATVDAGVFTRNARPGGRVNLGWMQPLARRGFLLEHGVDWPPLRHAEDTVFTLRLLAAGARMRLCGEAGYRYTQRRGDASGARSTASRTRRSAAEQQAAIRLALDACGHRLPPQARAALSRWPDEIAAVTAVLNARDAAEDRRFLHAAAEALRALRTPLALARAIFGRVGPGARTLR